MTPESALFIATGTVLIVSCICSLLEAALYSLPVSQIEMLASQDHASGKILKRLHEDIQRPISAILTLNTLANTGGAAYFQNSDITMRNSGFLQNTAALSGGGFAIFESSLTLETVQVKTNMANTHSGGGIYLENSHFSSISSTISQN